MHGAGSPTSGLHGHRRFTCATTVEAEGLARAGLGDDLLLANEVVDVHRLARLARSGARVTVAVDSEETMAAAAEAGVEEVVVDVNVGLPRCGCAPDAAGRVAESARDPGPHRPRGDGLRGSCRGRRGQGAASRVGRGRHGDACSRRTDDVGGDLISAGGTGTYDINTWATEIQAGSYALMDSAYGKLSLPFGQALTVLATVVSVSPGWAVADCGAKALAMDHGNPTIDGAEVWFCSDEHLTFAPRDVVRVGERIRVIPAHVDPTVAYHEHMHVVDGEDVLESWPVDLRGW